MRRRFAITLILLAAGVPWYWFRPAPPPSDLPAVFLSSVRMEHQAEWFGGVSGIDLTPDGTNFVIVTDKGQIARGVLTRSEDLLTDFTILSDRPLVDINGYVRDVPHTDAEGVALDEMGKVYVSFERAHRVLSYSTPQAHAIWPSYTRAWRSLSKNAGLEALALDANGTLFTLPENIARGAYEAVVYRRRPGDAWEQPFTIPVDRGFAPVGADFGPDGKLYLLERGFYVPGFFSRIRRMDVHESEVTNIETLMQTELGRHGNLEGLSVWQDATGRLRMTMVTDDNFFWFQRAEIIEYALPDGVAQALKQP